MLCHLIVVCTAWFLNWVSKRWCYVNRESNILLW